MRLSRYTLLLLTTLCLTGLSACDGQGEENAAADPQEQGSDLPETSPSSGHAGDGMPGAVEGSPGMAEDAVIPEDSMDSTEWDEEGNYIPHSDVPPPSRDTFVDAACDYEDWVGKPVDHSALKATGRPFRVLKPGDMMTMDHNPERINVEHDDNVVTRIWCG